jgi:thioredoxin-dependent peroxiredoxin
VVDDTSVDLAVGAEAPDFTLAGVDPRTGEFRDFSLSQYRGHPVVLVFYPADNSPVCTRQLAEYTASVADFETLDAQVLAISPQDPATHLEFSRDQGGFGFPLLADVDREVGRRFGVLGLLDLYRRCTFVVDPDGRIAYIHRYLGPALEFRPAEELLAALAPAAD